jgi:hypothetical protein
MGLRPVIIGHYLELKHGKLIIPLAMRLFWLIILSLPTLGTAQVPEGNLIPNWSFEIRETDINGDTICSLGSSTIYHTEFLGSARGSVDYMNACHNAQNSNYGVPTNIFGSQDAFDGKAYAHFVSYLNYSENWREFVWLPLADSLKAGQGYTFRMRVSRADSSEFGSDKIGAFFSAEDTRYFVVNQFENDFFNVQPQVESPGGPNYIISDTIGWTTIEGQFVAGGGEKFLTIGSFHSDGNLFIQQLAPLPYYEFYGYMGSATYYLDAVELYENNSIGIQEPEFTFSIYPNPATSNLTIESKTPLTHVWLSDLTGRRLSALGNQGQQWSMDVIGFSHGIYLVEAITEDGKRSVQKVVVE